MINALLEKSLTSSKVILRITSALTTGNHRMLITVINIVFHFVGTFLISCPIFARINLLISHTLEDLKFDRHCASPRTLNKGHFNKSEHYLGLYRQ